MAKKKEVDLKALSVDELNELLIAAQEKEDQEQIEAIEAELGRRERKEKREEKAKKRFTKLQDYKSKSSYENQRYKTQEWIDMSPAYKEVTCLPGIPMGHTTMCFGKSDTGKSTMGLEAAAKAQLQGIVPIFIITEKKFSYERAEKFGVDFDNALLYDGIDTLDDAINIMKERLDEQEKGDLPFDILFVWDSVGATPSKEELKAMEEGKGKGMMVTARYLREAYGRYVGHRINNTRKEEVPYTATALVINQAYITPPTMPGAPPSLTPYGGDGIYYTASLVFRQGGVMGRSSKIKAQKNGKKVGFALKSKLVVDKNHISNVTAEGDILCTDYGFLLNDKDAIKDYKEKYASDWDLEYDKHWHLDIE